MNNNFDVGYNYQEGWRDLSKFRSDQMGVVACPNPSQKEIDADP